MSSNELAHHGIKGMRWGVRRYQNKDGSLTPAGEKRKSESLHEDYIKAHTRKSRKSMSDAELRSRINRLEMERKYTQLSTERINKGKAYVNKSMKALGSVAALTTTAINIYNNIDKIKTIMNKKR